MGGTKASSVSKGGLSGLFLVNFSDQIFPSSLGEEAARLLLAVLCCMTSWGGGCLLLEMAFSTSQVQSQMTDFLDK